MTSTGEATSASRLVERFVPARLGRDFRWLLASSWTTNLGDGISMAAGPLLVARQSDDPLLIAMAATMAWLAPLLFALPAGLVTDRVDRRLLVVAVNLVRTVVAAVLTLSVFTDTVSIGVVLAVIFCLSTAETFADNASQALLPMLVTRQDLVIGNARLQTGLITLNQLAGPPVGAFLFAAGSALPFLAQTVLLATGAVLLLRVATSTRPETRESSHLWHDVVEGALWTWRHPAVRTLAITILTFNVTFGAAWSVLVLYAEQRLGLPPVGFGLITTVSGLGGLVGTLAYGWITRRVSLGTLMRVGLVIETLTHLALALTTWAPLALAVFFVFGAHAFIWGTTAVTVRQRAVPSALQGRVGAVYLMAVFLGLVVGSSTGGVLARSQGVTAPFWFAFAGSAVLLVVLWRSLALVAHDAEEAGAPTPADDGVGQDAGSEPETGKR